MSERVEELGTPEKVESRVVYVAGCWDVIHVGHLYLLETAKSMGDFLVVGVNTDECMRSYGKNPTIPYEERAAIVAALRCVDAVFPRETIDDSVAIEVYGATKRVVTYEGKKFDDKNSPFYKALEENSKRGMETVFIDKQGDHSSSGIKRRIKESDLAVPVYT